MFGIEGGHSIDNSFGALRMFQDSVDDGITAPSNLYMTLTHNCNLEWCDCQGGGEPLGKKYIILLLILLINIIKADYLLLDLK